MLLVKMSFITTLTRAFVSDAFPLIVTALLVAVVSFVAES